MIFAGKPVGILSVFCHEPYHFSATEFDVLSLLAAQGGIALTNAGSIRALKTQSQDMRMSFHRVGEALSASLDMGETLHLIVQLGLDMTHADAGAVYMRQSEFVGGGMRLAGMQGLDRRSMRRFRGGGISPIAKRAIAEGTAIVVPDTRRVPEAAFPTLRSANGDVAETRSLICIPLISGENVWGVLEQYSTQVGNFQQNEINLLTTFALQATGAIERAQIYAQECHLAETLQRAFLPELPQSIHGFQIGRIYAPGNTEVSVGGDTYDLFTLPDGRVALVIADVTGNGTTAATLSVMVKYTLRAYALENPEPSAVMGRLNKAVLNQTDDATFVSAIFGLIDPQTQKVLLTNAGHPDPLLYRASLKTCSPRSGVTGVLAGCLPDQKYTSYTIEPVTDDVLVFYTDGVVEARHGREQFGVERLAEMVKQNAHLNAQELAATIYSSVTEFAAGERADDFALLVLKAE
jgi:GAF domain-containing protein